MFLTKPSFFRERKEMGGERRCGEKVFYEEGVTIQHPDWKAVFIKFYNRKFACQVSKSIFFFSKHPICNKLCQSPIYDWVLTHKHTKKYVWNLLDDKMLENGFHVAQILFEFEQKFWSISNGWLYDDFLIPTILWKGDLAGWGICCRIFFSCSFSFFSA